eukprot:scaffold22753_cov108-Isochrysis_galbana.AAC.7
MGCWRGAWPWPWRRCLASSSSCEQRKRGFSFPHPSVTLRFPSYFVPCGCLLSFVAACVSASALSASARGS